jgi:predicted DNA-binding transcriptional regulator AlpA
MQDAPERPSPPQEQAIEPLTVRIKEACRLTGIGRSKLYT